MFNVSNLALLAIYGDAELNRGGSIVIEPIRTIFERRPDQCTGFCLLVANSFQGFRSRAYLPRPRNKRYSK